tara:strand:- start:5702 stop:6460 length:759 start_codon:yes stop_codon:yes gene_type:complete
MDPNHVPEEYKVPYDILELPSQGILYPNKKSSIKVEYLTTIDENILSSPNIVNSGKLIDILLDRKVKDLGFNPIDLLEGDRMAILIFLRSTAFGEIYNQPVIDPKTGNLTQGDIDLNTLEQKKLSVNPNENGEFDYELPFSKSKIKFKLLTGADELDVSERDKLLMERNGDDISQKTTLRLERSIMEVDGIRDKMKISTIISKMKIMDSRKLRKYIEEIEPGIVFKTKATIQGGVTVDTFLRLGVNFLWPEI